VIAFGNLNLTLGLAVFVFPSRPYGVAPGFIYIGLGLVCASILSKVLLLALVWRHQFALADWIPPIPIATCLVCLFTAAFLFQAELTNSNFFTSVRVLIGLGAVCVNPVVYRRGRNVLLERNANQPPCRPTLRAEPGRLYRHSADHRPGMLTATIESPSMNACRQPRASGTLSNCEW
jgi:hypothetical protein